MGSEVVQTFTEENLCNPGRAAPPSRLARGTSAQLELCSVAAFLPRLLASVPWPPDSQTSPWISGNGQRVRVNASLSLGELHQVGLDSTRQTASGTLGIRRWKQVQVSTTVSLFLLRHCSPASFSAKCRARSQR